MRFLFIHCVAIWLCFVRLSEGGESSCDPLVDLEAEFEQEKDEWRQEFSQRVERWEAELADRERVLALRESQCYVNTLSSNGDGSADASVENEQLALRWRHAAELRSELEALQFPDPAHCSSVPQLHFNYRQMGFGAAWHGITLALTYGYATRRTVTVDPQPLRWIWGDRARCPDGATMECLYERFTGCPSTIEGPHKNNIDYAQVDTEFKAHNTEFDWFAFVRGGAAAAGGAASKQGTDQQQHSLYMKGQVWGRGNDYVPPKYRQHGAMWWRSQLLGFVVRPQPSVLEEARAAATARGLELPLAHPCIGVHIRRGAKWMELPDKRFTPVDRYFAKVREVAAAQLSATAERDGRPPTPPTVYLATDDQGVLAQVQEQYGSEFNVQFNPGASRYDANRNVSWMDEVRYRWKHAPGDSLDLMLDVWLLAECEYFVGSFSSNIGRVIAELHYFRTNRNPIDRTAFSVDGSYKLDP